VKSSYQFRNLSDFKIRDIIFYHLLPLCTKANSIKLKTLETSAFQLNSLIAEYHLCTIPQN